MRRTLAVATLLVFLPAFVRAPFDHVHEHSPEDHAHGGFFHSHLRHFSGAQGPEWQDDDPDEDARSLDSFYPVSAPGLSFVAVLAPCGHLPLPVGEQPREEATEPRAHDPPAAGPTSPRSPPTAPHVATLVLCPMGEERNVLTNRGDDSRVYLAERRG